MKPDPSTVLQAAWPWLKAEYERLDVNLQQLSQVLSDPEASGAERENALIAAAELLCRTIRACREKDLFSAAGDDLGALATGLYKQIQRETLERLREILKREEGVLIAAGLDPGAAQRLHDDVIRMPAHVWAEDPLYYNGLDYKVLLATEDICHKFPKTNLDFKVHAFRKKVKEVKSRYGIVGGLAIVAANASVSIISPEPIAITTFSKFIGVAYTAYLVGGG